MSSSPSERTTAANTSCNGPPTPASHTGCSPPRAALAFSVKTAAGHRVSLLNDVDAQHDDVLSPVAGTAKQQPVRGSSPDISTSTYHRRSASTSRTSIALPSIMRLAPTWQAPYTCIPPAPKSAPLPRISAVSPPPPAPLSLSLSSSTSLSSSSSRPPPPALSINTSVVIMNSDIGGGSSSSGTGQGSSLFVATPTRATLHQPHSAMSLRFPSHSLSLAPASSSVPVTPTSATNVSPSSPPPTTPTTTTTAGLSHSSASTAVTKTQKRNHKCKVPGCGKAFTTSGHLARHNRIHTGEKNFPCIHPGCQSRFSRQDNMMQHYRTHTSSKSRRNNQGRPRKIDFLNPVVGSYRSNTPVAVASPTAVAPPPRPYPAVEAPYPSPSNYHHPHHHQTLPRVTSSSYHRGHPYNNYQSSAHRQMLAPQPSPAHYEQSHCPYPSPPRCAVTNTLTPAPPSDAVSASCNAPATPPRRNSCGLPPIHMLAAAASMTTGSKLVSNPRPCNELARATSLNTSAKTVSYY